MHLYATVFTARKTTTLATDMLLELSRREKIAGIKPDEDLDIFMKVIFWMWFYFLTLESYYCH